MRGQGMACLLRVKKKEMTISLHNFIKNEDGEFDEKGKVAKSILLVTLPFGDILVGRLASFCLVIIFWLGVWRLFAWSFGVKSM